MYGFDGLRLRTFPPKHASASAVPCFGGKSYPCMLGCVGIRAMTKPLVTAKQRAQRHAVGEARAAGRGLDRMPTVRLLLPDAHDTMLLADLDPADGAPARGLI